MPGSTLSLDSLSSPSPTPSPPPQDLTATLGGAHSTPALAVQSALSAPKDQPKKSANTLDSDSELSELTEEEQDAVEKRPDADAHSDDSDVTPYRGRGILARRAAPVRPPSSRGGRRKRSSIVPAPMWGWVEHKTANAPEEEEEEEMAGPPRAMEEEEGEEEEDDEGDDAGTSASRKRSVSGFQKSAVFHGVKRLPPRDQPVRSDHPNENGGAQVKDVDDVEPLPVHRSKPDIATVKEPAPTDIADPTTSKVVKDKAPVHHRKEIMARISRRFPDTVKDDTVNNKVSVASEDEEDEVKEGDNEQRKWPIPLAPISAPRPHMNEDEDEDEDEVSSASDGSENDDPDNSTDSEHRWRNRKMLGQRGLPRRHYMVSRPPVPPEVDDDSCASEEGENDDAALVENGIKQDNGDVEDLSDADVPPAPADAESENDTEDEPEENDDEADLGRKRAINTKVIAGEKFNPAPLSPSKLAKPVSPIVHTHLIDTTGPALEDLAPIAAAAAASSIMAGSAVIEQASPSSSVSGSPASSRSPSPEPSTKDLDCVDPDVEDESVPEIKKLADADDDKDMDDVAEENDSEAKIAVSVKGKVFPPALDIDLDVPEVDQEGDLDRSAEDMEVDEPSPEDDLEVESDLQPAHRAEALDVLAAIELKFALLREKVYVEKMDSLSWEESLINDGTHPELIHLHKELSSRRDKRLELASRKRAYEIANVTKRRRVDENATWSWWKLARDELQTDMISETNRKRRKLERERRGIERPQPVRRIPAPPTELFAAPSLRKIVKSFPLSSTKRTSRNDTKPKSFVYPELLTLSPTDVTGDLELLYQHRRQSTYDPHRGVGPMGVNPQQMGPPMMAPHGYEPYDTRMQPPQMPPYQHHILGQTQPGSMQSIAPGYPPYGGPGPGRIHPQGHPQTHGHSHNHSIPPYPGEQEMTGITGPGQSLIPPHHHHTSYNSNHNHSHNQSSYYGSNGASPYVSAGHGGRRSISPVIMNGVKQNGGWMGGGYHPKGEWMGDGRRVDLVAEEEERMAREREKKEKDREREQQQQQRERDRERDRDREMRERERDWENQEERDRQKEHYHRQQLAQQHRQGPPAPHLHAPTTPVPHHHGVLPPHHHHRLPHHHHVLHHHHGQPQAPTSSPRASRDYDRPHLNEVVTPGNKSGLGPPLWKGEEHGEYRHTRRPTSSGAPPQASMEERERPLAMPFVMASTHSMQAGANMTPPGPSGAHMNGSGTNSPRGGWSGEGYHEQGRSPNNRYAAPSSSVGAPRGPATQNSPPRRPLAQSSPITAPSYPPPPPPSTSVQRSPVRYPPTRSPPVSLKMTRAGSPPPLGGKSQGLPGTSGTYSVPGSGNASGSGGSSSNPGSGSGGVGVSRLAGPASGGGGEVVKNGVGVYGGSRGGSPLGYRERERDWERERPSPRLGTKISVAQMVDGH